MRWCRSIGAGVVWCSRCSRQARHPPRPAPFTESITRYDVDLTIEPAGTLLVRETIDYDFGPVPRHGIFRDIPTRFDYTTEGEHGSRATRST